MSTALTKNENRLTIELTGDRMLVKRIKTANRTKSGLIAPDTSQKEHVISQVIAVAPGMNDDEYKGLNAKVGDVIVTRAAGMPVPASLVLEEDEQTGEARAAFEVDEETRHIVRASDIIAFYTKGE